MKNKLITGIIFLLVGLGLGYFTYSLYSQEKSFQAEAVSTTGTVKDLKWTCSQLSDPNCLNQSSLPSNVTQRFGKHWAAYPIVEFNSANGRPITFTSNTGSYPPSYSIGQQVTVLYLPSDPTKAEIGSSGWIKVIICAVISVIMLVVGILAIFGKSMPGQQSSNPLLP